MAAVKLESATLTASYSEKVILPELHLVVFILSIDGTKNIDNHINIIFHQYYVYGLKCLNTE